MNKVLALILMASVYGIAAEANQRQNFPFSTLSKQDREKIHPRIFKYSPFERRCQSTTTFPVTDDLYLLVPNCSSDSRDSDPNVIYYNAQKDTWKLGPEHKPADTVYDAARVSNHEFKVFLRKSARMKGLIGSIYHALREPSWIKGDWDPAEEFVCTLDTNANTYNNCSVSEKEPDKIAPSDLNAPAPLDRKVVNPRDKAQDSEKASRPSQISNYQSTMTMDANPKLADELTGVYKRQLKTGLIMPDREKEQAITAEDTIELAKVTNSKIYFRVELMFYNGHSCSIYGIAHQEGNSFVYKPTDHDENCVLVIKRQRQDLFINDNGTCDFACGARGSLSDYTIPLAKKRPIKYLPLLLKSEEYRDAIYEDQIRANEPQKDSP